MSGRECARTLNPPLGVAVLVATRDRPALLIERSLPSIARQSHRPESVLVVNDGTAWSENATDDFESCLDGLPAIFVNNERVRGAGGAWNMGLSALLKRGHAGFVAMLDDDDEWETDHLAANMEVAMRQQANIVVSGLRIRSAAGEIPREFITTLRDRDFLTGNPGWQGSNTFVDIELFAAVGGFRESLRSLHDRDLAIRLLRHPEARPALVQHWTATWRIDLPGRLSDRRGSAKLDGLRTFWTIYGHEMSDPERAAFFDRAERLFGFSSQEICTAGIAPSCDRTIAGDLCA